MSYEIFTKFNCTLNLKGFSTIVRNGYLINISAHSMIKEVTRFNLGIFKMTGYIIYRLKEKFHRKKIKEDNTYKTHGIYICIYIYTHAYIYTQKNSLFL